MAKKITLANLLDDWLETDHNVQVSILSETGTGTEASYAAVATEVPLLLIAASHDSRERRSLTYSKIPTHECYLKKNEHLTAGRIVLVTHTRSESGAWEADTEGVRYEVLGGERQYGVDAPRDHVRHDLCRITKGV